MKQYHYTDGNRSYGPFTIEELQTKNITPETLVWTEELVTWTKAKDVYELSSIVTYSPPPLKSQAETYHSATGKGAVVDQQTTRTHPKNTNFQRPPKTYLIESILATVFCCLPLGIPAIIYASRVEKKFYEGDLIGAERDSANARKWIVINIIFAVISWLGYVSLFGLALFSSF